jgi:hypothetical protein
MISIRIRKSAIEIARRYNVNVFFYNDNKNIGNGFMNVKPLSVNLNVSGKITEDTFIGILFHELGHVHCVRNNLWSAYHYKSTKIMNQNDIKAFRLTAHRAECWVDKWGKKEMKKIMPHLKYRMSYKHKNKTTINFLNRYYKPLYDLIK